MVDDIWFGDFAFSGHFGQMTFGVEVVLVIFDLVPWSNLYVEAV